MTPEEAAGAGPKGYRSSFAHWDRRACVRVKPARVLESDGLFFPPELVPAVAHPLVRARGDTVVRRILTQRLFGYLHFTTELEQLAIMPVTMELSRGRSGLALPDGMRADAFKITTDEAWHAQLCDDLARQVATRTGVTPRLPDAHRFAVRVADVGRRLGPGLSAPARLVFATVSETLISTILVDLPHDDRLPRAVRDLVGDHAEDEGRHHAYFRRLLPVLWPGLGDNARRQLGPLLPDLISAFLEPDYRAIGYALADAGLRAGEVEQVLVESYPATEVRALIGTAARATVRYFAEVGALDDPATAEAFATAGLT